MISNAAGQLLGYSIQFPRALTHLLQCKPGDSVCIELLGDVATVLKNGTVLTEEDKSSIVGNPLTNRSTDLWKTLSNWIKSIEDGTLTITNTFFILYTNNSGRRGLVNIFNDANTKAEAVQAIVDTKEELKDIDSNHEIWEYYDYVVNRKRDLFEDLLQKFRLEIGEAAAFEDVRLEIRSKIIAESQVEFILESLNGWLHKIITENIAHNNNTHITWEEFDKKFSLLFDRARRRELIDFTLISTIDELHIEKHIAQRPCYIKQLEAIGAVDDEIMEAVSDFLKAKVNRDKWIENEIIDEELAQDFENKLLRFWSNKKTQVDITNKLLSETERGMLLYIDCKSRQETLRGESPPSTTIAGTYHALADSPVIGWHPEWEKSFKK